MGPSYMHVANDNLLTIILLVMLMQCINTYIHVHYDVVTDCSYALAGFLVPTLFGVSPGQS